MYEKRTWCAKNKHRFHLWCACWRTLWPICQWLLNSTLHILWWTLITLFILLADLKSSVYKQWWWGCRCWCRCLCLCDWWWQWRQQRRGLIWSSYKPSVDQQRTNQSLLGNVMLDTSSLCFKQKAATIKGMVGSENVRVHSINPWQYSSSPPLLQWRSSFCSSHAPFTSRSNS